MRLSKQLSGLLAALRRIQNMLSLKVRSIPQACLFQKVTSIPRADPLAWARLPIQANDGDRTRDLLLTKQMLYH